MNDLAHVSNVNYPICEEFARKETEAIVIKKQMKRGILRMRIGVPKEIKTYEYRVGLTPGAVREYVAAGHTVTVETSAGAGIGASDELYRKAGATIAETAREVFTTSEMIVKVKEPQATEWAQLREDHILFTYLHLAADPEQ